MPYAELTLDQGATFESTLDLVADDGSAINVAGYLAVREALLKHLRGV